MSASTGQKSPRRFRMSRRQLRLVIVCTLILIIAGVAEAYLRASGTGTGSASTADPAAVALSPGAPGAGLHPAGSTNVVLTASNPNAVAVRILSLILDPSRGTGGFAVDTGHSGCGVTTLSYVTQNNSGAGWTVPAKVSGVNGTLTITLANALSMSAAAANSCQGASLTVYVTAAS